MPRFKIERHHRAAVGGADELHSELFDKGDIESKCRGLSHTKPYPAPAVHVNETMNRTPRVTGTMRTR